MKATDPPATLDLTLLPRICWVAAGLVAFLAFASIALADAASKPTNPRYRLITGKGYSVCEAYLKHLNAFPPNAPPMVCTHKLHPRFQNFTLPKWEELDIWSNLDIVYAADVFVRYTNPDVKKPTFDQWRPEFEQRVRSGENMPLLRRTRLALNDKGEEVLIAYEPDVRACESALAKGWGPNGGEAHVFVYRSEGPDRPLARITGSVGSHSRTDILIYRGKPHFATTFSDVKTWWLELHAVSNILINEQYVLPQRCGYRFDK